MYEPLLGLRPRNTLEYEALLTIHWSHGHEDRADGAGHLPLADGSMQCVVLGLLRLLSAASSSDVPGAEGGAASQLLGSRARNSLLPLRMSSTLSPKIADEFSSSVAGVEDAWVQAQARNS